MFFDHKTKKLTGELGRTTRDDLERSKRLIDAGILVSTEYPSDEELVIVQARFRELDVEQEISAAEKAARRRHK